ncbi:hypothetical protein AaE_002257 [Aphanomyces astaci]|uniref:Uncharacterized protein n=1 Tax=Aphanomyces astaci TaxID=112090 RepID=A0A6A5AFY6_APHAT|nr:hypothetical protein AaE_002257 [Aphanomyces astaci]
MAAAELDRHVRVQRALDQVNGISISRIYNDALAQNKAKKSASAPSFEERIEAIMMKTQEIAQRLQLSQRQCLDSFDSLGVEADCIDDDDDESVDGFTIMDDNAHASHSFKRQLSRFLLLPRSLSQREMEEITDMVLLEVNNTPDHSILMHEIGSLIDEHVLTPRDDVSSPSCDDDGQRHHRDSLSKRRQVSITTTKCPSPPPNKDLPKLDIQPLCAVDMAQRHMFKSANKLHSLSFRVQYISIFLIFMTLSHDDIVYATQGGFDESHAKGLTSSLTSKPTMRSLFGRSDSVASSLQRSPTYRGGSPSSRGGVSKADLDAADVAAKEAAWKMQVSMHVCVKEDYIMWLRAKAEAAAAKAKSRKDERVTRKKKKPRWLLLYEQGRLQQQH